MPTSTASAPRATRIAILAYRDCMATEMFGIADVLLVAGHMARALSRGPYPACTVELVAVGPGNVRVAGGVELTPKRASGKYDLLVVPGLEVGRRDQVEAKLAGLAREVAFIGQRFAQGTQVASICIGTFLLGAAGLLDGRRATTAWLFAADVARRYPAAHWQTEQILIEDGGVITTGAVSSAFDLAIFLVKRIYGARVASATARVALLPNPRASQAPYVDETLMPQPLPGFARAVQQWLGARLREPYALAPLAAAFHVSARTLLRRVKAETGDTPLALLQHERIERAKQLLGDTNWSIARIVEEVGYADVPTFSRLFATRVGETPAKYRRR